MKSPACFSLPGSLLLVLISPGLSAQPLLAGTPQVDLSLSAEMTPGTFIPGGRNRVTLTLHNAGPDAAGTIPPMPYRQFVVGDPFDITASAPLFEVVEIVSGCAIERFVSEPLPDGRIELAFVYYFDAISAGQSRTCIFDIVFDASAITSVPGGFNAFANSNDNDWNPANNRLSHTYVAAPVAQSTVPVAALSRTGVLALLAGLFLAATLHLPTAAFASRKKSH